MDDPYLEALRRAYQAVDADRFRTASTEFLTAISQVSSQFNDYPGTQTTERELGFHRTSAVSP